LLCRTGLSLLMIMSAATVSSSLASNYIRRLEDVEEDYQFLRKYNVLYENCFVGDYSDVNNVKEPSATFRLCPSSKDCKAGCTGGGKYTANFNYFLDAFTELQMKAKEYACEMVRESCAEDTYYEGDDEGDNYYYNYYNYYNCYIDAGINAGNEKMYKYCINNESEELDLQEYLECEEFEYGDEDGNALYIGPYCSDSIQVYIGIFSDMYCTKKVGDPDEYENYENLKYTVNGGKSVILQDDKRRECAKCKEHGKEQDQNANDKEDEDETLEQCEELYSNTGFKCEYGMTDGKDSSGCSIIGDMEEEEDNFQPRETFHDFYAYSQILFLSMLVVGLLFGFGYYLGQRQKGDDTKLVLLIPNRADLQ